MKSKTTLKMTALSGVLATAMTLVVVVVAGLAEPDYSHSQDMISELNASGMPYAALIGYVGFLPIGLVSLLFVWRLRGDIPGSIRAAIGLVFIACMGIDWIVTALAPCDLGCPVEGDISLAQKIHLIWGFLTVLLVPVGVGLLVKPLRQAGFGRVVTILSMFSIATSVVTFMLMVLQVFPEVPGLMQRMNLAVFLAYLSLLSVKVYARVS